jgi:hypothetical protein
MSTTPHGWADYPCFGVSCPWAIHILAD